MTIAAKIIKDSVGPDGQRATTIECRYPRFIHAEALRHRWFSRSVSSSRAIPVRKLLKAISDDPAMPVFWGANQAGMQASLELTGWRKRLAIFAWYFGLFFALMATRLMLLAGAHKQIANRICEPWQQINEVVTGTSEAYANFFALRLHRDAQPEIRDLAEAMYQAYKASKPTPLKRGEWHLPYIEKGDIEELKTRVEGGEGSKEFNDYLCRISAAKCARVSYRTHDGKVATLDENLELFNRLVSTKPMHASPTEHQCMLDFLDIYGEYLSPRHAGNLSGFIQFRKLLVGERVIDLAEAIRVAEYRNA